MRRILILIITVLLALLTFSCSKLKQFELGFTPTGIPIKLSIDGTGVPKISCGTGIHIIPIGYFEISYNTSANATHRTCVEIINRHEGKKYVFELREVDEKISWETNKWCKVEIRNQSYCTIVTVDSEEISNLLHERKGAGYKPHFPSQSFAYFYFTKKLVDNVNWEINNVGDFFANILFAIFWCLAVLLDLLVICISFIIRLLWWFLLLIFYLFGFV
ncbi:hypothetical protein [Porphyromonas sp. COT-108 OH1349]|uniref:hypothetical protein n=1 Tax=Porphyromonas sp. COT-108 OH1349 TaxID=1537504 RepID=UPI00052BC916|nr:hypothetical protein [Porphyromonas sp. COT-108 OH1349]KGN67509.1 hypothetical protein JT26_09860 [Porphyromonas sp. COT-108 OH1349]